MMRIWEIAKKNLKVQLRDKKVIIFGILIPIFYYSLMGFMFGGIEATQSQRVYQIGWVEPGSIENETVPPELGPSLTLIRDLIDNSEEFEVTQFDTSESALDQLQQKKIDVYLVFPDTFDAYIQGVAPEPATPIEFCYRESTSPITRNIISGSILAIIDRVVNYNPTAKNITAEVRTISGQTVSELTNNTPGFILYGVISSLAGAVIFLTTEHKEGQLKRLETTEMQPKDMILGHLLSNTVIIFIQILIALLILSLFSFRPIYADPVSLILGIFITVCLLSFFMNTTAMILSAFFKKPDVAAGGVWMVMVPLMLFSGSLIPLEVMMPKILPYVAWIPTRIVVLIFQDLMLDAVSVWDPSIWLQFVWLALESGALYIVGNKMYRKFVQSR